jgi:multidrug efflux system outer membrane protein
VSRAGLAVAALVLAGCTLGPDYRRPSVPTPAEFRGAPGSTTEGSLGDLAWWEIFGDETLHALIREAIASNYDVKVAASRVLEARALVTIARSSQLPEAGASGQGSYSRVEGPLAPLQARESAVATGGLDLSFELDLWGRFRRGTEAARAELVAGEEGKRFVITALVSDVGSAYLLLRAFDQQIDIARRTLASREQSLSFVRIRESGGVAGLIDVRQAEILVAAAAQSIPEFERQIEQTENVISILLGRPPAPVPRGRPLGEQITAPSVPAGLPSSLLERRADVRQAEARLAAATARIGVARADFFPRVFLTGSAGAGGVHVGGQTFGPQGLFAFGPSITLPIFNAGRVAAGVTAAEARARAALAEYQQVVLGAFRDVSDALVEHDKRREARVQQEAFTVAARDATRLANLRYTGGVSPYLEVLDSERQLFLAELGLIANQRDELLAVVRLYKALGGGWP